jgi:hypothetical protein
MKKTGEKKTHIIIYNVGWYNDFDYYFIDDDELLLSIFMNIDTPIVGFCEWASITPDRVINSNTFSYNDTIKITVWDEDRERLDEPIFLDEVFKQAGKLLVNGNFVPLRERPYYDESDGNYFNKDRIKQYFRDKKLEAIL